MALKSQQNKIMEKINEAYNNLVNLVKFIKYQKDLVIGRTWQV